MFQALFNIILNLLATIVQIVCYPLNLAITNALPDISDKLSTLSSQLSNLFGNFSWAIGWIPLIFREIIVFIIVVEVAKYTCYISIHGIIKVWNLFQKLKFW